MLKFSENYVLKGDGFIGRKTGMEI